MSSWPRIILHADMDAFYAAVEQLDFPELRGKPIIVGHPGRRGVVTTASYEARPFGVGSAMPMARAMTLCPQAIVVPPRFVRYQQVSAEVMRVFGRFSPKVEALSLDEAFLDMSGAEALLGPPEVMGASLKRAVREATGLSVSVGIATTKFVAKVASDHRKPDGLMVVPKDQTLSFLWPLPVRRLWGVGPKAEAHLLRLGLRTIGDVAKSQPAWLTRELGSLGTHIYALAHGRDAREVEPERDPKSIGHEETLDDDIYEAHEARPILLTAADTVARRLRSEGLVAGGVRVKVKTASFKIQTRQQRLASPTSSADPLYAAALVLLEQFPFDEPIRLVGLAATSLAEARPRQGELFSSPQDRERADLDRALDAVREKFGGAAVRRASELEDTEPRVDRRRR